MFLLVFTRISAYFESSFMANTSQDIFSDRKLISSHFYPCGISKKLFSIVKISDFRISSPVKWLSPTD